MIALQPSFCVFFSSLHRDPAYTDSMQGKHELLRTFLEASAASGAWESALAAVQLAGVTFTDALHSSSSPGSPSSPPVQLGLHQQVLLTQILSQAKQWEWALRVARHPLYIPPISTSPSATHHQWPVLPAYAVALNSVLKARTVDGAVEENQSHAAVRGNSAADTSLWRTVLALLDEAWRVPDTIPTALLPQSESPAGVIVSRDRMDGKGGSGQLPLVGADSFTDVIAAQNEALPALQKLCEEELSRLLPPEAAIATVSALCSGRLQQAEAFWAAQANPVDHATVSHRGAASQPQQDVANRFGATVYPSPTSTASPSALLSASSLGDGKKAQEGRGSTKPVRHPHHFSPGSATDVMCSARTSGTGKQAVLLRELATLCEAKRSPQSWQRAVQCLDELLHLPVAVTSPPSAAASAKETTAELNSQGLELAVGTLVRNGREREVMAIVYQCILGKEVPGRTVTHTEDAPAARNSGGAMAVGIVRPSRRLLKVLAEAANTMHSVKLCRLLMEEEPLSAQLTPSSAIPLLLTLRAAREWAYALQWWQSLPPVTPSAAPHATLRTHLNLCSYVASCVALGGHAQWQLTLDVFIGARDYDPTQAMVFAVRALRVAGAWQPAVTLFTTHLQQQQQPKAENRKRVTQRGQSRTTARRRGSDRANLQEAHHMLTEQNAAQWIPTEVVDQLRAVCTEDQRLRRHDLPPPARHRSQPQSKRKGAHLS